MINYKPEMRSSLWENKSIMTFDSIGSMTKFIADKANSFYHYIGKDIVFSPDDVELHLKNKSGTVTVSGIHVGHCWEC